MIVTNETFPKSELGLLYFRYKKGCFILHPEIKKYIDMLYFVQERGGRYLEEDDASQVVANIRVALGYVRDCKYDKATEKLESIWNNLHDVSWQLMRDLKEERDYRYRPSHRVRLPSPDYWQSPSRRKPRRVDYATRSGSEGFDALGMDMHDLGYY